MQNVALVQRCQRSDLARRPADAERQRWDFARVQLGKQQKVEATNRFDAQGGIRTRDLWIARVL